MRYIITHGHIFKNAGTTFDSALERAFGKDFCDHRDDKSMLQGRANYLTQFILDNPDMKALSSHHLCNPLPVSETFQCIPVYFVRNPIERVLSVYNFERKQKRGSKGAEMASRSTLEEYVRWRMTPEAPKVIFDYQTSYIGKTVNLQPGDKVCSEIFKRALDIIASEIALVGVVERFDDSFQCISKKLLKYFPDYEFTYKKKNVANRSSMEDKYHMAVHKLGPVLADVISGNVFDAALHKVANEKLDSMVSRI